MMHLMENDMTEYMNQLLQEATLDEDMDRVRSLVAMGADLVMRDVFGRSPLHWAAASQNHHLCRLMLELGADANSQDNYGFTPLDLVQEPKLAFQPMTENKPDIAALPTSLQKQAWKGTPWIAPRPHWKW